MFNPIPSCVWIALVNTFLFAFTQGVVIPLFPLLSQRLGLSLPIVIGCFSLGTFLFVFMSPYWALKSENIGRIKVLFIGSLGLLVSLLILIFLLFSQAYPVSLSLLFLVLSRLIYGLTASGINPVAQSIQADSSELASRPMVRHSLSLNLGRLMGFLSVFLFIDVLSPLFYTLSSLLVLLILSQIYLIVRQRNILRASKNLSEVKKRFKFDLHAGSPFLVAFCFAIYLELIHSSLAGKIERVFNLTGERAAEQSAILFVSVIFIIVLIQLCLLFVKEIPSDKGRQVGALFMVIGGILFSVFSNLWQLYVAVLLLAVGLALVPMFNLAKLKTIYGSRGYSEKAGWISSYYTLGYSIGGLLAAFSFLFKAEVLLGILLLLGSLLLWLCFPVSKSLLLKRGSCD